MPYDLTLIDRKNHLRQTLADTTPQLPRGIAGLMQVRHAGRKARKTITDR